MFIKFKKILALIVLGFFALGISPANADDALLSELVKQEANRYCDSIQISSIDSDAVYTAQSNAWASQIRTSVSGSRIVMPVNALYKTYSYCHIFDEHMDRANGLSKHKVGGKSQFKYAYFPAKTMDIAMEVINKQPNLVRDPTKLGRATKEYYSSIEGQKVKVVLQEQKHWKSTPSYNGYDWIIISLYPVGF